MTKHFGFLADLKGYVNLENFNSKTTHKGDIMKALVHAADIGNPSRKFNICKKWALCIMSEFFKQGDKEKSLNLEISQLCDRKTTNISKA